MTGPSIFFDVTPLTPATGFYFAVLLAVALFVKFGRLLSIRNWDVLTLFLPVPGLLLLLEHGDHRWAYGALLLASLYFFVRCLFDLALVRRPALSPNLTSGGLFWLGGALFVSLMPVRPLATSPRRNDKATPLDAGVREPVVNIGRRLAPDDASEAARWAERGLALLCHLSVVCGLVLIGRKHFDDLHTGAAAAALYLLLPYAHLLMPESEVPAGRWDHAWPMAWMVWAVLAYRRPMWSGAALGVACGTAFFPALTLPAWLGFYRRRGLGRFLLGLAVSAGLCLLLVGLAVWVNGELPRLLRAAWSPTNWQPWQAPEADTPGVWQGVHWAYRLPVFLVWVAFALLTLFWPAPKNLAHVLALSAATLIGTQFWYADQGGVYVLWYLPFLLLLVFRPNLSSCVPPPPPDDDWLARCGRAVRRWLRRRLRLPEPARAA
jgi:hypothetical protein